MKKPIISIIVPIYNVEAYLPRCMESLLHQTMDEIEIILVDDGSPDGCPKMCDEYAANDSRVKVIHKENGGLGFARNSGLEVACGEYIAFVDSDDYVTLDMCEKLYNAARRNEADVVYGGVWKKSNQTGEQVQISDASTEMKWTGEEQITSFVLDFVGTKCTAKRDTIMEISVWKAIFKKEIFDKYSIKFVSERQFISEDLIFDLDFLPKAECIAVIPDCIYYYCYNPESLSKVFRKDRFIKEKELYYEVMRKLELLYSREVYQPRLDRMLIARARVFVRQMAHSKKQIGKKAIIKGIKEVCADKELQDILKRYSIWKLPKKYAAVAYLMKKKYAFLLNILLSH